MNVPSISGKALVKILVKSFDFNVIRQSGSHIILEHLDGRMIVVPCHSNKDLPKGLLIKIIKKELGISLKEFIKILSLILLIS